jgi:hypothetical protein
MFRQPASVPAIFFRSLKNRTSCCSLSVSGKDPGKYAGFVNAAKKAVRKNRRIRLCRILNLLA